MGADIPISAVETCLGEYGAVGAVNAIAPMRGAFHNTLYRITAVTGELYLKVLSTHVVESTEERYEYIAAVMERVRGTGVEVPLPIRNRRGLVLTACGPFKAVLSAAVGGEPFEEEDLAHQEAAGRSLGAFHEATCDLRPGEGSWLGELGAYLLRDASMVGALPQTPDGAAARERFGELLDWSRRIAADLEACGYGRLPRAVIHSEYCGKHLRSSAPRMRGDEVCGILDFEYTHRNARAVDVGLALGRLFCVGREAGPDGPARARAFLEGYGSSTRPLSGEELAALPVLVKTWDFECITYWVHQMAGRGDRTAPVDMGARIESYLGSVVWWEEHGGECAEALARVGGA